MEKNEVVEVLALARVGKSTEGRLYESLEHAIKCVEFMPKLVEALEVSISYHSNGWGNHHINEHVEKAQELLKKAKELIE